MRPVARTLAVLSSALVTGATSLLLGTGVASAAPAAPAGPAAPVAAPAVSPCAPTAKACMSISQRKAWLTDGAGHVTYGPVSALGGTKSYPTPTGTFSVDYKDADHVSNLFTPGDMPNSVFFAPAIAFHQGSLSKASHGCIHLGSGASKRFFSDLKPGDEVQVVR